MGESPNARPAWAEKVAMLKKRHESGGTAPMGTASAPMPNVEPAASAPIAEPATSAESAPPAPATQTKADIPIPQASKSSNWLTNLGDSMGLHKKKTENLSDKFHYASFADTIQPKDTQQKAFLNVVEATEKNVHPDRYTVEHLVELSSEELSDLAGEMMRIWLEDGGDIDHNMDVYSVNAAIGMGKKNLPPPITNDSVLNMLKINLGEAVVSHYFEDTPVTEASHRGKPMTEEEKVEAEKAEIQKQLMESMPKDAVIERRESSDKLHVFVKVIQGANGGKEATFETIRAAIVEYGITVGVNEDAIRDLLLESKYGEWIEVAAGKEPIHGVNGKINELYPRQLQFDLKEKEDGSVDFKEINTIQTIDKGAVICTIEHPTQGVDGMTVRGAVLKGRNGLYAVVPSGDNTVLNADKTQLLAATDGSLVFRGGRFNVEPVLRLENVDAGTGNIRFNGDVVVRGRVQAGYTIHCKGNVKVEGIVEGAEIYANGSILLTHGINGMGKGLIEAKGEVTAKFIESCTVHAGGKVKAETIVNSVVESDEGVEISGTKGRIVGGSITSFGSIKARRIGSRAAAQTVITLGVTPSIIKQKEVIEQKIAAMEQEMGEINKNLAFLEQQQRVGRLTNPDYINLLHQLRLQLPVHKMKFQHLQKSLAELEAKMGSTETAQLVSQKIYPPTRVNIGRSSLVTREIQDNARIYMNMEGEISIGIA